MVLTNFASGELSKTLFGRIDLPQYFSGAAHMENFDVIPTGGIKRRSGFERLLETDGSGRIIPFYINREVNYLLHLIPNKIREYKIENGVIKQPFIEYGNNLDRKFYETVKDIEKVQYAQNHDSMILCHEDYKPIIVRRENNNLYISTFNININVDIEAKDGINKNDFFENDKYFIDKKWFNDNKEWPKAVAFMNNRLYFAGTRNNPQRVFVSKVDSIYNFSTYKKFITEKKEYIFIDGKINIGTNKIDMNIPGEFGKFVKPLTEYYIQSPYFNDDTMLAGINDHTLLLTKNTKSFKLSQSQLNVFTTWKNNINTDWSAPYEIVLDQSSGARPVGGVPPVKAQYNAYQGKFKFDNSEYNLQNIQECVNTESYLYNFIRERVPSPVGNNLFLYEFYTNIFIDFVHAFYLAIQNTLKYPINIQGISTTLYGTPEQIYQQVLGNVSFVGNYADTSIVFYLKEPEIDIYPTPDCGFTFEVSSKTIDIIQWLAVNKCLIIGTDTGEYLMPPDVHANNIQVVPSSRYGSDYISGEVIGNATCFFQTGRKSLVEYYPNENDHFRANNMALLSPQMLHESQAKEFDFTTAPYTKLFITREDGQMVTLLYDRTTGTFAWTRISTGEVVNDIITPEEIQEAKKYHAQRVEASYEEFGEMHPGQFVPPKKLLRVIKGKINSCAVIPGKNGFDDVYLLVDRENISYLERLQEDGTVYLDSWKEWKFKNDNEKSLLLDSYKSHAVVYDEKENKIYKRDELDALPPSADDDNPRYIGYQYQSIFKSMPVIKNEKMQEVSMTCMYVRLLDSYIPDIWGTSKVSAAEPVDGVLKIVNMLEGSKTNLQFSIIHDKPNRCKVLSVYAEV